MDKAFIMGAALIEGITGKSPLGVRLIDSLDMVNIIEDWSRVRSPGRARRRMRQGHKQNVVYKHVPKTQVVSIDGGRTWLVHPAVRREVELQVAKLAGNTLSKGNVF